MSFKNLMERFSIPESNKEALLKNQRIRKNLLAILPEEKIDCKFSRPQSHLLVHFATKMPKKEIPLKYRFIVRDYILNEKLNKVLQIDVACKYLESRADFNTAEFEAKCGVGVKVSDEEIVSTIRKIFSETADDLLNKKKSYKEIRPFLIKRLNEKLPWADGRKRIELLDSTAGKLMPKFEPKSTPKNGEGTKKGKQNNKGTKIEGKNGDNKPRNISTGTPVGATGLQKYLSGRKLAEVYNTEEIYKKHLERTGNVFRTRFPPEPNGYLHIGHAKAMNFNFSLAAEKNGVCFLRYDDTNPLAEKEDFINSIKENVEWLGYKPFKITYSSDYFDELHSLAIKMIKKGAAYVCHQSSEQIRLAREQRRKKGVIEESPYRNRPIEESLKLFEEMRNGRFAPGEVSLRLKGDLSHPNPNMWDPVAYRIIDSPHLRSGSKWRIYPSYDFTHCIVDSLEDIDASCCTLEFENRRESYFWLLNELDLFKPVVWEFSRLNMDFNVMSKRRMSELVDEGIVDGWDDPRLLTLNGLRRRGIPAEAIHNFCDKIGVTRADNSISPLFLNHCAREVLDKISERSMCVLDPLEIILTNFEDNREEEIKCPFFPAMKEKSKTYIARLRKVLYIERNDFREKDSKKFFGLAPGKTVRLKYAFTIRCERYEKDENGKISKVICSVDLSSKNSVSAAKGFLHWVSPSPGRKEEHFVTVRCFERLFDSQKPGSGEKPWREELNRKSKTVLENCLASETLLEKCRGLKGEPWDCRFQFERKGFFCLDKDSVSDKLVFNETIPLKESKDKI